MKKIIFVTLLLSLICGVYAQNITISFQPKDSGTLIDSIQATNLNTGQVVKLTAGESLILGKETSSTFHLWKNNEMGYIYPNPSYENATFCFSIDKSQEVELRLFNVSGQLYCTKRQRLYQGSHSFELEFPELGIYFLSVLKSDGATIYKAIYNGMRKQNTSINYLGGEISDTRSSDTDKLKNASVSKTLEFTAGDIIHYSFYSGVNNTIMTDIPEISKTIDVEFVSCLDRGNRSYKVVKIGGQWWMAENLAYLPVVSPPTVGSHSDPLYYVLDYDGSNLADAMASDIYKKYGALYNWPAALKECPEGWHLPSDKEWMQLEMALGMTQIQADEESLRGTDQGHQLKATFGWYKNGNGSNSSGFTGLPSGGRYCENSFMGNDAIGFWWAHPEDKNNARIRALRFDTCNVWRENVLGGMENGWAVRCILDDPADKTVKDADGNVYNTVRIGTQVWMAENLKTTSYSDGTPIPNITDNDSWAILTTGAYCNYDNLESNAAIYGRLYNWYAINTGKLAPEGWHVATDDEWNILENFLLSNGYNYDGTKDEEKFAKSICAKTNWAISDMKGSPGAEPENNNSSGFSLLPGGYRSIFGTFSYIKYNGNWWSATANSSEYAYYRTIYFSDWSMNKNPGKMTSGYSVRLIKD